MRLSKKTLASAVVFALALSGTVDAQQQSASQSPTKASVTAETVADRIETAQKINTSALKSQLATKESERLAAENEVRRMMIQARELESQLNTSLSEVERLRQENERYQRMLSGGNNQRQSTQQTQKTTEPPLDMRVVNILKGDGITTRARVMVMAQDGSPQGEFQVKEGGSIQGWRVDRINQNTIRVKKDGRDFTYGSDGIM